MALEELNRLNTLAFTHRVFAVDRIGLLHIAPENLAHRLAPIHAQFDLSELMMLSTCNRVEFTYLAQQAPAPEFNRAFLQALYPELVSEQIEAFVQNLEAYSGIQAVEHAMSVASSIDSMILGEREIITQTRQAYEHCHAAGLTGDVLRILNKHTIQTAKRVYSETSIASKPVSVVSLAYHQLSRLELPLEAKILMIGAGVTNTTMGRFLKKHGFTQFTVFNRTLEKAQQLAEELGGQAFPLKELDTYQGGFDVLISCTGAEHLIVSSSLYEQLLQGDTNPKTLIDLAIPQDLDPTILAHFPNHYISVAQLQAISDQNLQVRGEELSRVLAIIEEALREFEQLFLIRQAELAMRSVPEEIKRIKLDALQEVFKEEIDALDPHSREVLEKVLGYVEKKYIAGPMKLAKEILVKHG